MHFLCKLSITLYNFTLIGKKEFFMNKFLWFFCAFFSVFMLGSANTKQLPVSMLEQSKNVEFICVYFTSLAGDFKQLTIPSSQIESALKNGLKFDGSSIPGYANIFNSDMHLVLDSESFFVNPVVEGQPKTARIFAYVNQEDEIPYLADPRYLLKEAILLSSELNYEFYVGPEIEFFLLEKDDKGEFIPWGKGCYFGAETEVKRESIKFELMQTLLANGVVIEKMHHEVAPGQYEFSIQYDTPMKVADQIMLAKHLVKQVAHKYGLTATFMPKPFLGMNGSGMHINLSIADKITRENLFFDSFGDAFLSGLAKNCIAGIINRIAEGAVILNSSVNSFKRLVPGYEAPVYICWAKKNRSSLIRIPQISINQSCASRIELRSPDALCNPYLAFTFLLQSSLAGIMNEEFLPYPIEENLFKLTPKEVKDRGIRTLPSSLEQALYNFENSPSMRDIFNHVLIREFIKIKSKELEQFQKSISLWELQNCL